MLAILIYVVEAVRRALRKIVRAGSILLEIFCEAQAIRRAMPRGYTEE